MAAWKDISYKGNNNPALGLLKYRLDSSSNAEHVPAPTGPPGPEGLILPLPFSAGTRQEKEQAGPVTSKSLPRKRGILPPCRAQSCWFTVNPSRDSPSSSPSPPDSCPSCPSGRWLVAEGTLGSASLLPATPASMDCVGAMLGRWPVGPGHTSRAGLLPPRTSPKGHRDSLLFHRQPCQLSKYSVFFLESWLLQPCNYLNFHFL